jgi:hypothetical protein
VSVKILIDTGPSRRGWHRLESAAHCAQLYALRYVARFDEIVLASGLPMDIAAPHLVRGTLGHIGLAHYYARLGDMQHGKDPERFYDPETAVDMKVSMMVERREQGCDLARQLAGPVKAALRAYISNFAGERLQIRGVETVVEMLFEGHVMTQRFDLVFQDRGGRIWVMDHKFVGRANSHTMARYVLSGQFLEMHHQGLNAFGEKFGGVRVNLIGMGSIKVQIGGETVTDGEPDLTKYEFRRASPEPAPHALTTFPATVAYWERQIEAWRREFGENVFAYPKAISELVCIGPYGKCPAWEACRWGPSSATPMAPTGG